VAQLLGGHLDAGFPSTGPLLDIQGRDPRILGVASWARYADLPDVPTLTELDIRTLCRFHLQNSVLGMPER